VAWAHSTYYFAGDVDDPVGDHIGYDLGRYGDIYGDGATVPSGAYTLTAHGYFKKPNPAIVGWGGLENENLDAVEVMINKIIALEAEA
jgi:hypothetical protein